MDFLFAGKDAKGILHLLFFGFSRFFKRITTLETPHYPSVSGKIIIHFLSGKAKLKKQIKSNRTAVSNF